MRSTDLKTRSLVKAISYRLWGTLASVAISFALTKSIGISLVLGSLDFFGKIILYYLHERVWDHLSWGRPPDLF